MVETEALKTLRNTIEKYLNESFGGYMRDKNNNYIIQAGRTMVLIMPLQWVEDQTVVKVVTVINLGAPVTAELTHFLVAENMKILFGKFSLDVNNQAIIYEENLFGDYLSRKELEVAVQIVAVTAEHYKSSIGEKFGGKVIG